MATEKAKDVDVKEGNKIHKKVKMEDVYEDGLPKDDKAIKAIKVNASRSVVASFITETLIALFLFQMVVITVAYIIFIWRAGSNVTLMKQTTESVMEGVKSILPATTTLLGVVIGYYFREITNHAENEEG